MRPVTDTYFGTAVADRYRYFENLNDPVVKAYFKDQNAYTRAVLARLDPARERLFRANNATRRDRHQRFLRSNLDGSRYFYLRRAPGDSNEKLCVRDAGGGQERVLVDPDALATKPGQHFTINYFHAVPRRALRRLRDLGGRLGRQRHPRHRDRDGQAQLPDAIDRAKFVGVTGWRPDGNVVLLHAPAQARPGTIGERGRAAGRQLPARLGERPRQGRSPSSASGSTQPSSWTPTTSRSSPSRRHLRTRSA